MEHEFECTKIRDGLYLGNLTAIQVQSFICRTISFYKSINFRISSIVPHKYPTISIVMASNTSSLNLSKRELINYGIKVSKN